MEIQLCWLDIDNLRSGNCVAIDEEIDEDIVKDIDEDDDRDWRMKS